MIIPRVSIISNSSFSMWDSRTDWTYAQISLLWELSKDEKPLPEIVACIGKPQEAVRAKAAELGISLNGQSAKRA